MEERIKYLFRQYIDNKCSRKEYEEFFSYVRLSEHDETMRELVKAAYAQAGDTSYIDELGNLVLLPAKRRRNKMLPAIAAGIAVLAIAAWFSFPGQRGVTRKITERSEYKYIVLPDSTKVWLNAASTLEFPSDFDKDKREVRLSGEAYFDVQHAENAPFIIHTGKVSTTVLGTAFNIKAYPGQENIIVSVSHGKVRVNYGDKAPAMLTQGQQLKVNEVTESAITKKAALVETAPWKDGSLAYDGETMEDIVADLVRVYNVNIRIDNKAISVINISTSFRRDIGIKEALHILCRLTDSELLTADGMYVIK
jgi:ferric-dicitrate binding protein FerR (iron transport regulator)